ncbi:related to APSES transcription factor [Cephalotrichum gorgonifer]|uniref:Related to APSES transcription factor n=1 Tax=Cephalotrichum gorgonifer TaxID=2041049 RepID=A0AAE8SSX6_9PEZI|nr:related to APSES transcription factor [Cephalotrichum gorgonifer]
MAPQVKRNLPERKNHLLLEDIPEFSDLVSRRLLGQTKLSPKIPGPGAPAQTNLGAFDYAHLRAPMPKNIVSGIFKKAPSKYYLMRRSRDGYVSATGMFKATFPYAEAAEEEEERQYIKSLPTTSQEETAGNVWVPPEQALLLAEEYLITPWIKALLDPTPVALPENAESKTILAPPTFELPKPTPSLAPPTPTSLAQSRGRRSVSPSKLPKKATASPRKRSSRIKADSVEPPRTRSRSQSVDVEEATARASKEAEAVAEPAVVLPSVEEEPSYKEPVKAAGKPSKQSKKKNSIDIGGEALFAAGAPPTKEETMKMLEEAKQMVEAANEVTPDTADAPASTSGEEASSEEATEATPLTNGVAETKTKRKATEISAADEVDKENQEEGQETEEPRAKKARTEIELRKQRIKRRALFGISATVAVGAIVPWLMGAI